LTTKFSKEFLQSSFVVNFVYKHLFHRRFQRVRSSLEEKGGESHSNLVSREKKNGALFSFFSEFFETRHVHVLQLLVHGVFVATGIVSLLFQAT